MCGIVGGTFKTNSLIVDLNSYWSRLYHRGFHSYGVLLFTPKKWFMIKALKMNETLEAINRLIHEKKIDSEEVFIIAHNRWASTGNKSNIKFAHPVLSGNWIVIHNGTNKQLLKFVTSTTHDTRAIAKLLNIFDTSKLEMADSYFFKNIGVMFAYNKSQDIFIFHRDITRSLFWEPKLKIFASEPIESGNWILVPPGFRQVQIPTEVDKSTFLSDIFNNGFLIQSANKLHSISIGYEFRVAKCERCKNVRLLLKNGMCAYCNIVVNSKNKSKDKTLVQLEAPTSKPTNLISKILKIHTN